MYPVKIFNRFSRSILLTLVLFVPVAVVFVYYVRAEKQIDRTNDSRHVSFLLADELRQSSDDLTRFARTYVITGEPQYKQHYQDVLDIRDGKKPRPEGYQRIYWDLVSLGGPPPHPDSRRSVPLLALMQLNGCSREELTKLAEAKANSDRLAQSEFVAMRLAESTGPDAESDHAKARRMLHDRAYHESKARIMRPINEFYSMLDQRTEKAVHDSESAALKLRGAFIVLAFWLIFMVWHSYRTMRRILGGSPDEVFFHIEKIGNGDFSQAIPVIDDSAPSVLGSLAETRAKLAFIEDERDRAGKLKGQFRAIVESSNDAIISKSLDGKITTWNPAAEKMFGYTAAEILGQSMELLIPPDHADEEQQILFRIRNGELIEHFETVRRKKNGECFPISATISPIKDGTGMVVGASKIARDISDRIRVEQHRSMGRDILRILNGNEDLKEAIQQIIGLIKSATGVDAVGIRLQDRDDFPYFCQEGFPPDFLKKENSLLARNRDGGLCRDDCGNVCLECTCGLVISGMGDLSNPIFTAGGSAWTNNSFPFLEVPADQDPRTNPRNECIHQGFASVALIPIRAKGLIVGLLQLNGRRPDCFTLEGIKALEDVVENIGEAMLRKQAERKLISSERFLRTLTDQLPGMVGYWTSELRCKFANRAYLEWFGKTQREMIGISLQELLGEDLYRKNRQYVLKTLQGEVQHFERALKKPSGETGYTWANYLPDLEDGTVRGFFVLISDVTELKKSEEERVKLEAQLHQVQKMESIGSLAGGVAHDFNNKLSVILGHAYLALAETIPEQVRASLEDIRKAAEQSADLTRQLLAFARKQTIVPKVLDLNETVAGMLKMLNRLIGEDIELTWQPAPGLWPLRLDPSQIDQILVNLCVNARDAISGGGKITIATENHTVDDDYCSTHLDASAGEYVRLAVSDSGCGMSREISERIFEPFFTTKEVGKGTGLGLATVFGIVKQNDGFINVYSEPERGTTFTVHLPRHADASESVPQGATAPAIPVGREKILLVEDEPAILNMATIILKKLGYSVLPAHTPTEAVRLAQENAGMISLLITDVIMPEMNGRELATGLQAQNPRLKCLFMSGYTADAISVHGVLEAGVHFIHKPFSLPDFAVKVREVLDGTNG